MLRENSLAFTSRGFRGSVYLREPDFSDSSYFSDQRTGCRILGSKRLSMSLQVAVWTSYKMLMSVGFNRL